MVFDLLISQYMKNNATEVLNNSRDYIVQGPVDSGSEPRVPHKPKPNGTPMGKAETVVLTSDYAILYPTESLDKYYYQCVILSSPTIKSGSTYTIYTGGESIGEEKDGYYSDGTYSDGTKLGNIKIEDIVTQYGTSSGNMPGGARPNEGFSGKEITPGQKPNMNDYLHF